MISWIVGILVIVCSLVVGGIVMAANMMSDSTSEQAPVWPAFIGLIVGIALIVGHHYGAW